MSEAEKLQQHCVLLVESLLEDYFAKEQVRGIARRVVTAQMARRTQQIDGWDSEAVDVDLYDHDDIDWDGQYSSGRNKRVQRQGVTLDVDYMARNCGSLGWRLRMKLIKRMRSVEFAVRETLFARGETHFTDQKFCRSKKSTLKITSYL